MRPGGWFGWPCFCRSCGGMSATGAAHLLSPDAVSGCWLRVLAQAGLPLHRLCPALCGRASLAGHRLDLTLLALLPLPRSASA